MSVRELKEELKAGGVNTSGMLEKDDLVAAVKMLRASAAGGPTSGTCGKLDEAYTRTAHTAAAPDRGTTLLAFKKKRADVAILARKTEQGSVETGTYAALGQGHIGPPSSPMPAGGLLELERVYHYISIQQMTPSTDDCVHSGRYTVVRQIVRPLKHRAISTVVEDLEGFAIVLEIHNLLSSSCVFPDASFAVPVGAVLLILDPYLTMERRSDGSLGMQLRVDNPTHIVPLNLVPASSLPPALRPRLAPWLEQGSVVNTPVPPGGSANALAAEGKELFKLGKYAAAATSYTLALELLPDDAVTLSSRAQCMLNLGEAGMAVRDARRAHELAPGNERAALRLCKALYALQCWKEAAEALKNTACLAGNADAQTLAVKLTTLLTSHKPSEHDLSDLVRRRFEDPKPLRVWG